MDMISLQSIAHAVDGQLCSGQVRCAYPGKDRRKIGGLAITPSSNSRVGFMVNSFYIDVSSSEAFEFVKERLSRSGIEPERAAAPVKLPPKTDTRQRALALWDASIDPRGTLAERYLNERRGLQLPPEVAGKALRWNGRINALIGLFRDLKTDTPAGVTRIFLTPDGRLDKSGHHPTGRMFLGSNGGAGVKLHETDSGLLCVAEGVETALAATQMGIGPCWALGSCTAIATLPVLPSVDTLILCAETDSASQMAVASCARRWAATGRDVMVAEPGCDGDMNDALQANAGYLIAPWRR